MAQEYFSDLNYTLANEDTRVEYELLKEGQRHVFSIAGSGARCLPLIAKNPQEITIVDMSPSQIYLVELRLAAMRTLSYEEYLFFMGYRGALVVGDDKGDSRYDLFSRLELSEACKEYWTTRAEGWSQKGFILLGRWESHFQKLGKLFRDQLKCDFSPIFYAQSLAEQKELFDYHWPSLRWSGFLRIAASEYVFNKFLYKGHFSGGKERKTDQRAPWEMIDQEFKRIFQTQLVRKNYFFQILFLGEIRFEEGLPLEAQRHVVDAVKKSSTRVHYQVGNLLEVLPAKPWDFVSLSDTISYLDPQAANQILQNLHVDTKSGSRVVIRSFLRAPQKMDIKDWKDCEEANRWAHQLDGTGVYQFHIFEKT